MPAGAGVLQRVSNARNGGDNQGGRVVYSRGKLSVQTSQFGGRGFGITCKVQQITRQVALRSQLEAALI